MTASHPLTIRADHDRSTLEACLLAAAMFAVYVCGASRTIYVGDSGELTTAVALLGIPHPSGYPLYVMLGKLWTVLVPIGSIAFRMSMFSAFCTATACASLYWILRRALCDRTAALTAALMLGFAPSVWSQANIQRVYGLNTLFVVVTTGVVWSWARNHNNRTLLTAYFLCGLGACNHTFMIVYGLALSVLVVLSEPRVLAQPFRIASFGAMTVLGLLPYTYLPLRSRFNPRLDWGNPETLDGFLGAVFRRDFWERAWMESPADFLPIGLDYLQAIATETAFLGAALALVGLATARKLWAPALLATLVMAGNFLSMATHGSRSDIFIWHRYYAPSLAMIALLAGVGAHTLLKRTPRAVRAAPLLIPLVLLAAGWRDFDRSRYRIAEAFSTAVLDSVPPGASLIATDDNVLFVLMYLHLAEGLRPDIDLILQGVGGAELPPLRFNPDSDDVFFTHHPNWNIPGLEIVPLGVVFQARRAGAPTPDLSIPATELPGEKDPSVPKDYLTQNLVGLFHYMLGFTFENRDWPRAYASMQAAAKAAPENDVLFYNLGLVYWRNGLIEEAVAAFEHSHEINPRHLASAKKPRAADKLRELRSELTRLRALEVQAAGAAGPPKNALAHRQMATWLDGHGEPLAAHGHTLRAEVLEAQ